MDLLVRFTEYLNSPQNNLAKKTVKNYRADLNSFFSWYKKQYNLELNLAPSAVTSQIVESYKKSKIQDSNLSSSSLNRHLSSLRKFFQFLKTEGIISQDPFEEMKILSNNALDLQDKWHLRAFKNYLYLNNKSSLTIKNYIIDLRHFLAWTEQVTKENVLSEITVGIVNEYKKRLLDHGFSPRTINRKLSSIRQYLKWTTQDGLIKVTEPKPDFDFAKAFVKETPSRRSLLIKNYSRFPPLRLIQKTFRGLGFLFDISVITPLIKLSNTLSSTIWKIKGKPVFIKIKEDKFSEAAPMPPVISAIPKEFYAPLAISTRYFPLYKKVWYKLRFKRPEWYKTYHSYSITHYFHLAILILFISQLIIVMNYSVILPQNQSSVLGTIESISARILSFSGQLTDSSNNPIRGSATAVRMSIYNDEVASGSSLLWQEVVGIATDSEGKFSTSLGNNTSLPQSFFEENHALWLGVSVGQSEELIPREPIAGTSLAANAEKLQGLSPITNTQADTKNVILALDSSGNLTIDGNANPTFQATSGTFKLLGQTLVLSTTPGTNTNVEITPMDLGKIDLQKPIFNSTNNNNIDMAIGSVEINDSLAVLATTSATSAFVINQNSTGKLISAYTLSSAKFEVDNNGNIISQSGSKWQPFSNSTSALNIANAAGNAFVSFDTTNSKVVFLQDATERGAVFFLNSDSTFHIRSASGLGLDSNNSNTPSVYISTSGNVGIGTITPALRLDVQDSQAASAAAQIFNTSTGSDADGLIVKLGNTSSSAVENTNHFISFETAGIGIVGSVRGTGAAGVDFRTTGIADFAEYLKKDKNQTIEYGSLICIDEKGLVLPCNQLNNKIVGIASDQGGFTGGNDLGDSSVRVGFVGQVYTKVSNMNGDIKPGDPLASSSIPGVAMKATKAGQIVGKALEGFFSCHPELVSGSASSGDEMLKSIRRAQDPEFTEGQVQHDNGCAGKILVVISISWYDPSIYISNAGNILTEKSENSKTSTIVSPIPEIDKIHTDIISPLPTNPIAIIINNSSEPEASTSAAFLSNESETHKASSESASQFNNISSYSAPLTPIERLSTDTDLFTQELMAFGPTSLADTSITGQLSIGATIIQDNSINTIGTVLELQPLRQGALSLMGGLVYIDTDGNLKVDGNAHFAKDVAIGGDLIASGSGTFSKLNLSIAKNAFAVSSIELIATGSAGAAFVRPREAEVTIYNKLVTDKSLIYITPAGTPSGQTPYLLRQKPESPALSGTEGSFTVGIASKSATPTPFNWLIIN